jgi:hypothetical protein
VLSRALLCIGGLTYPPRFRIVADLLARLRAGAAKWYDMKTMAAVRRASCGRSAHEALTPAP